MPYFHHFLSESLVNNKCYSSVAANQQRPNNNGMLKQVKSGYLLHYKKRLFGKAWREEFVVLYEDSSVIWFRDRDRLDPEGGVFLRESPEMLAAGQWVSRVPNKPEMPAGCNLQLCIAMGCRNREKVQWFLCKSQAELIEWMSAISKTLPPPPPPPEELRESRLKLAEAAAAAAAIKSATPPPNFYSVATVNGAAAANGSLDLAQRLDRVSIRQQQQQQHMKHFSRASGFTDRTRSYSAGRLNQYGTNANLSPYVQQQPPPPHPSVSSSSNLAAGVLAAGVLTQWNSGPDCWDWGMGWGWTNWNAAFCGTCAMEQAALAGHIPVHNNVMYSSSSSSAGAGAAAGSSSAEDPAHAQFYFDDDHELGELGETADVGCDFGDFGAF